jgi:hypothetical protein
MFLNEIPSFLTFLLSDQLIFHSFHLPSHHHQINSPLINLINPFIHNRNNNTNYDPTQEQNKVQFSDAKSTRELNKGRGAKKTSIKTLSTLIPLITCFDCRNQFNEPEHQLTREQEEPKQVINCMIIRKKSMLIIQNSDNIHFNIIKKLEKLLSLTKNNRFYEKNKLIKDNHIIKKKFITFNTEVI